MNKRLSVMVLAVFTIVLAFVLCACGSEVPSSSSSASSSSSSSSVSSASSSVASSSSSSATGKTLVAYFSATGNTAPLAKYAAEALDADLFEIVSAEPYTSADLNYNDESTRATVEQHDSSARPAISGDLPNMDNYDTVVLAYPIWWGQEPRIMDTFAEGVDLNGKTIAAFCTSGGSDIGTSDDNLAALSASNATWLEGKRFEAGASKAEIESWLKNIGLLQ